VVSASGFRLGLGDMRLGTRLGLGSECLVHIRAPVTVALHRYGHALTWRYCLSSFYLRVEKPKAALF